MVLLTSSAISAAISAGIVCTFTFLLFLCGYVLQQQTVRSLQEALRNPPPKEWFPTPVLPPQFRDDYNETEEQAENQDVFAKVIGEIGPFSGEAVEDLLDQDPDSLSPLQLWQRHVRKTQARLKKDGSIVKMVKIPDTPNDSPIMELPHRRLAYIFTIPHVSDLCSAALFAKWHRRRSTLSRQPGIVFIYPAGWETSDSTSHTRAMDLIRDMQDTHDITCHPVSISRIWAGVSVESQLLAELQRTGWAYDRAMYLRLPGVVLDITALDRALSSSSVLSAWQRVSSKTTSSDPSLLLYVAEKGLQAPKGVMRRLAMLGTMAHESDHADEWVSEAKDAAYVILDEDDLQRRKKDRISYGGIFERFERDREDVCNGLGGAIEQEEDVEDEVVELR